MISNCYSDCKVGVFFIGIIIDTCLINTMDNHIKKIIHHFEYRLSLQWKDYLL